MRVRRFTEFTSGKLLFCVRVTTIGFVVTALGKGEIAWVGGGIMIAGAIPIAILFLSRNPRLANPVAAQHHEPEEALEPQRVEQ